jgi:GT2 family glycosyltransferase
MKLMEMGFESKNDCGPQTDMTPRVSVIIVTYGSRNEIPACIESLLTQDINTEIFLVDNASPDDTPEIAAAYAARYNNIHAILNQDNIGLAAANNLPLGKCQGQYVFILNPDTVLCDDTLSRLVNFLDQNPDVGVVGPKNLYEDRTRHSSFHKNWGLFHVLIWRVLPYRFSRSFYDRFSSYKFQDVLFVSGASLMIRRSIFESIGGYDPEYFLTVEDACDLCIRARETGCRVVFLPDAEVIHLGGRSGAQAPSIGIWHGCRGTVYHFLKHKGVVQSSLALLALVISSALRTLIAATGGVFQPRYRSIARIYAMVVRNLLVANPLWGRARPRSASTSTKRSDLNGAKEIS